MRVPMRIGFAIVAAAAAVALTAAGPAGAATAPGHHHHFPGRGHAVFVQTDNPAGNEIAVYHRSGNGTLTPAATYRTGGRGGVLDGSVVDHLASQGSLGYVPFQHLLVAVNAGSDSVSVFSVHGDRLRLRQVTGSGGTFPVSVAIRGDLVYVLNALDGGSVQGYRLVFGHLLPIPGSRRALGLDPTATPQFTNTPGQVAFSPRGSQLIVTTKANGNDIDVFGVLPGGRLTASPVVNPEPGTVPFGVSFDRARHLVVTEAGPNALATFTLHADGSVSLLDALPTGQAATCWVTPARGTLYASNAGSASLSRFRPDRHGQLTLLGQTTTDPGTVDATATPDGRFLYVQTGGNGIVDEFAVGSGGGLTPLGSVTVAGAVGGEGIAAS
jgi:hypothetical protein